jgi:dTDP-4-dehydrorhamnose reductase
VIGHTSRIEPITNIVSTAKVATMAKVAITGSNGFVGGNIAKVLQRAGHDVVGLVRTPQKTPLPWATSVVDLSSIDSITQGLQGCTAVVHSAIANDFNKLQADRAFAYDSYVALTQRVTHAANRAGAQTVYAHRVGSWMELRI